MIYTCCAAGVHDDGRVFWRRRFRVQITPRRLAQTNRFAVRNNVDRMIVKLCRIDCFQRILNHDLLIYCDGLLWAKMTNFEGNTKTLIRGVSGKRVLNFGKSS